MNLRNLKIIIPTLLAILCSGNAIGQVNTKIATFSEPRITLPKLVVGSEVYTNVILEHLGDVRFKVVGYELSLESPKNATAELNGTKLNIGTLNLANETYIDLELDYIGGVSLELQEFTGPIEDLKFEETSFSLVEPESWELNELVYDLQGRKSGISGNMISNAPIMDVDGDGLDDILIISILWDGDWVEKTTSIQWLKNTGNGSFEEGDSSVFPESTQRYHYFHSAVADFNSDGRQDLFVIGSGYDKPPFNGEPNVLILSSSDGSFYDAGLQDQNFNYSAFTHALVTGDVNNDGHIDIVTSDIIGQDRLRVLVGDGDGNFSRNNSFNNEIPFEFPGTLNLELLDIDDDGYEDLIVGSSYMNEIDQIYLNDGLGVYSANNYVNLPKYYEIGTNRHLYDTLAIAKIDLNFDGLTDLVFSKSRDYQGKALQFLKNNGDKSFTDVTSSYSPWLNAINRPGDQTPYWLEVVDIDLNGYDDLILKYDQHDKYGYQSHIWLRMDAGPFVEFDKSKFPIVNAWHWVLDVDGDGDFDLAARSPKITPSGEQRLEDFKWGIMENLAID